MDNIDITKALEDFYHHLNETSIDRTIFSARFGDGKTEFLKTVQGKIPERVRFLHSLPCQLSDCSKRANNGVHKKGLAFPTDSQQ